MGEGLSGIQCLPRRGMLEGGDALTQAYVVASEGRVLQGQQEQSCWLQ